MSTEARGPTRCRWESVWVRRGQLTSLEGGVCVLLLSAAVAGKVGVNRHWEDSWCNRGNRGLHGVDRGGHIVGRATIGACTCWVFLEFQSHLISTSDGEWNRSASRTDTLTKMESQGSRCKIVVVGDTQCGKTALLHVFAKDCYPEVSVLIYI